MGSDPSLSRAVRVAALLAAPVALAAQAPVYIESPAFGGTSMFLEGVSHMGRDSKRQGTDSFFAMSFSQGDFGADKFFSRLEALKGGDPESADAAARAIKENPWGMRSHSFGLLVCEKGASIAFSREETTSLWAVDGIPGVPGIEGLGGFEVRRAVGDGLTFGYTDRSDAFLYGSAIRVERWALGAARCGPRGFSMIGGADPNPEDPLDYMETQGRSFSYAMDAFLGLELASGLRLGVQANRLNARRLGDVEEKTQYRAGLQIDMGQVAQLSIEKDLNEAARLPFPAQARTEAASLRIKANSAVTFSVGAERRIIGEASSVRCGAVVWLTGKQHHLGAGFQFGGERSPWGATWKMY